MPYARLATSQPAGGLLEHNPSPVTNLNRQLFVSSAPQEDCCGQCAKVSDCAAAVFSANTCWLKTASDLLKKSSVQGATACVVQSPHGQGQPVKIPAKVPGDLLTDLQRADLIGDPLYELNFLNASIWDSNTWTYTTTITVEVSGADSTLLVFDGVKMGARILIDGSEIGKTTDQFLR